MQLKKANDIELPHTDPIQVVDRNPTFGREMRCSALFTSIFLIFCIKI